MTPSAGIRPTEAVTLPPLWAKSQEAPLLHIPRCQKEQLTCVVSDLTLHSRPSMHRRLPMPSSTRHSLDRLLPCRKHVLIYRVLALSSWAKSQETPLLQIPRCQKKQLTCVVSDLTLHSRPSMHRRLPVPSSTSRSMDRLLPCR